MFSFVHEARDQTRPGSLFSRSWGRGERDPGNEVDMWLVEIIEADCDDTIEPATTNNNNKTFI